MSTKPLSPRETGKFVTQRSKHVTIDDEQVEVAATMLAESFVDKDFTMTSWKEGSLHPHVCSKRFSCNLCYKNSQLLKEFMNT